MKERVKDDVLTLAAIGILVSMVASLAHEAIGHGVGCAVDGGRISLITFLVFRCAGAGTMADGGGPVGVLLAGCVALTSVRVFQSKGLTGRLFLLNFGAITLLWVCGQAMEEAFDGSDDWGHVAHDLGWSSQWHWLLALAGLLGYIITLRMVSRLGSVLANGRPARLLLPYATATLSAVVLGALWHGGRAASALDGFLSFGVAPVGLLLIARRLAPMEPAPNVVSRSVGFVIFAGVIWLAFALTVARGWGPLS
ncbi:hypothetical protein [Dyella amyloliquefaciens]|uniref:hypothetical protein n=1 Tax=Dyella amyloliquefaciens TaxID=1770545 RepID=UPI00102EC6F4|nr:hypothetical protein [Dyella amyloliquefaciens]